MRTNYWKGNLLSATALLSNVLPIVSCRILVFFLFFLLSGCSHTDSRIGSLESRLRQAESAPDKLKQRDWDKLQEDFVQLEKDLYGNTIELSAEQRKRVNKMIGRYAAVVIKRGIGQFKNEIDNLTEQLQSATEELTEKTEEISSDLEEQIQGAAEAIGDSL
jgi:hypothetical protein